MGRAKIGTGVMKWVYIEDVSHHVGEEVEVRGWIYNQRSGGNIRFLLIRQNLIVNVVKAYQ